MGLGSSEKKNTKKHLIKTISKGKLQAKIGIIRHVLFRIIRTFKLLKKT